MVYEKIVGVGGVWMFKVRRHLSLKKFCCLVLNTNNRLEPSRCIKRDRKEKKKRRKKPREKP